MENSGEYKTATGCVCPLAGFCAKHGIRKNPHFHHLCQTRQDYFNMYEKCIGPGQEFTNCDGNIEAPQIIVDAPKDPCPSCNKSKDLISETKSETLNEVKMPSLWQQAKNLTKSAAVHIASGMGEVTPEEQKARLDLCEQCPFFDHKKKKCGKCGCMMLIKTKWPTSSCPIGLWGPGRNIK